MPDPSESPAPEKSGSGRQDDDPPAIVGDVMFGARKDGAENDCPNDGADPNDAGIVNEPSGAFDGRYDGAR